MWWVYKALLQGGLSLLPFGESVNHQLQRITGGNAPEHVDAAVDRALDMLRLLRRHGLRPLREATVVEVGTGWQPTLPVVLALCGAARVITFDHVPHLRLGLAKRTLRRALSRARAIAPSSELSEAALRARAEAALAAETLDEHLRALGIEYRAPGDAANTGLTAASVDLFLSSAVLEHVPVAAVSAITREARRTLRSGGLYYNYIGLHDHFVSFDRDITRVNFLKVPDFAWRLLAQNDITYMNRLRNSEFVDLFSGAGFDVVEVNADVDEASLRALPHMSLAARFARMDHRDLATHLTEIVCRR
jgi:SAM-dependent methyltransferase